MAWDFNGSNDNMEGNIGLIGFPHTIACWFNTDSNTTNQTLLTLNNGSVSQALSPSSSLRLVSTGVTRAVSSSTTGNTLVTGSTPYTTNTWQHIAATFAATNSRSHYFQGLLENSNTTDNRNSTPAWVIIGSGGNGTYSPLQYTNGRIAEVGVWNAVLTADEILSLARGVKPSLIRPQSLYTYIPLVRDVADYRNGVSITNNATAVAVHTRRYA
jgi:hypothetical protein